MQSKGLLALIIILNTFEGNDAFLCKFRSLNCLAYPQQSIAAVKQCRIRAVARNDNYANIHIKLMQSVHSCEVTFALLKRANGWKPFLYNFTFNGCKFLKNPSSNPVAEYFYNILKDFSNFNHSCPYEHDIVFDKFRILNKNVKLPFPEGVYGFDTLWKLNGILSIRANGSCIGSIHEELV